MFQDNQLTNVKETSTQVQNASNRNLIVTSKSQSFEDLKNNVNLSDTKQTSSDLDTKVRKITRLIQMQYNSTTL